MAGLPPPPRRGNQNSRPMNSYAVVGLIKGISTPQMAKANPHLKMQILLNILLSYINSPEINMAVFQAGFDFLSDNLKGTIGQGPG